MAEHITNFASRFTNSAASAVHGVHGMGEVIRGTANSTMDGLVPNHESKEGGGRARQDDIAQKGLSEMRGSERYFRDGAPAAGLGGGYGSTPTQTRGYSEAANPSNTAWSSSTAPNMSRQDRERERLWEAERRQREAEYQHSQKLPGSFPADSEPSSIQQPTTHQVRFVDQPPPPPPVTYANPAQPDQPAHYGSAAGQAQSQPFQQNQPIRNTPASPVAGSPTSQTLRGSGSSSSHGHGHGFAHGILHHNKKPDHGQGSWLSQGGVRASPEQFGPHQASQRQAGDSLAGSSAARLAWTGGR